MAEDLQLITFFVSFLYGIMFGYFSLIHYKMSFKYNIIFKYLTTFVFILDIVLGYILLMYKINDGMFHIYFLIVVFVGFIVSFPLQNYVKKNFSYLHNLLKWPFK